MPPRFTVGRCGWYHLCQSGRPHFLVWPSLSFVTLGRFGTVKMIRIIGLAVVHLAAMVAIIAQWGIDRPGLLDGMPVWLRVAVIVIGALGGCFGLWMDGLFVRDWFRRGRSGG